MYFLVLGIGQFGTHRTEAAAHSFKTCLQVAKLPHFPCNSAKRRCKPSSLSVVKSHLPPTYPPLPPPPKAIMYPWHFATFAFNNFASFRWLNGARLSWKFVLIVIFAIDVSAFPAPPTSIFHRPSSQGFVDSNSFRLSMACSIFY